MKARLLITLVATLPVISGLANCINRVPVGGVMLVIATDGTLQPDELRIRATSADGMRTLDNANYAIPGQTTLPTTVAIASNGDPNAGAIVDVSVWLAGRPLDTRHLVIQQIPTQRVAALDVIFGASCTPQVQDVNGEAMSTCPPGFTCSATNLGVCASDAVNASDAGTYEAPDAGHPNAMTGADGAGGGGDGSGGGGDTDGTLPPPEDAGTYVDVLIPADALDAACGSSNCAGCCTASGACDPNGDTVASCGFQGARCQDCTNQGGACALFGLCVQKSDASSTGAACTDASTSKCAPCIPGYSNICCKSNNTCGCAVTFPPTACQ